MEFVMNVDEIYSRNVISASRSSTLEEAAILMRDHHIGALLITEITTEDESKRAHPIGILTDRDLVLQAIAEGMGPREATVGEVMTPALVTVSKTADIREAMVTMRQHGIRRLGVTEESGALIGVVSLDDIMEALGAELGTLAGIIRNEREREVIRQTERNVMTS
jgi:CBS-domain-containing membrane protein